MSLYDSGGVTLVISLYWLHCETCHARNRFRNRNFTVEVTLSVLAFEQHIDDRFSIDEVSEDSLSRHSEFLLHKRIRPTLVWSASKVRNSPETHQCVSQMPNLRQEFEKTQIASLLREKEDISRKLYAFL